jgi:predicted O-methyltransferase YrrM
MNAERRAFVDALRARNTAHDAGLTDRRDRLRTVEAATAELLGVLVRATRARRILELGTSSGYGTIWLADAAEATGGRVLSLDVEPARTALARANLAAAALGDRVELRTADAATVLPTLPAGAFELVFADAERAEYPAYFEALIACLAPGGLVVADNAVSHAAELAAFRALVDADARLSSALVEVGAGVLLVVREPAGAVP